MRLFSAPDVFIPDAYGTVGTKNRRRKPAQKWSRFMMAPVSGACGMGVM